MNCTAPTAITGGTILTSEPYLVGEVAVFQCNSGYVMSGTAYITCTALPDNTTTWTPSPSCALTSSNTITLNNSTSYNFPDWLVYFIAGLCGILTIAILTCLLVCCLQLIGCYGAGGLFGEPRGCYCCVSKSRVCTILPRNYEYDEEGRRFHFDDLGRRCYIKHRKSKAIMPEGESRKTSVVTVKEVQLDKKPAKDVDVWKPFANPVRSINTSTK